MLDLVRRAMSVDGVNVIVAEVPKAMNGGCDDGESSGGGGSGSRGKCCGGGGGFDGGSGFCWTVDGFDGGGVRFGGGS
ncbi:Hypothetical predicted protein [Olea europaea subsp. europaea]|uniref:Uncharacterized protein n=1 Tax=Olea europaea subsp. europaea TaxID=158383 RepID=A0A8S0Q8K5_OLEEU|nr:Hypothetical predicted protein [Olea europaea subsp. europaea]